MSRHSSELTERPNGRILLRCYRNPKPPPTGVPNRFPPRRLKAGMWVAVRSLAGNADLIAISTSSAVLGIRSWARLAKSLDCAIWIKSVWANLPAYNSMKNGLNRKTIRRYPR